MDINLCDYAGIYSITTTIDNRFYIGSTVNLWRRYKDHNHRLKNKIHANKYMQAFSNKYGLDKFSFNLLFVCKNTCLRPNEKLWIDLLKPQFNIKPIIERPHFEDVVKYNNDKMIGRIERVYESMGIGLDDRYTIKKYKHLEHLTVTQELHYYSGIPVFSSFPKRTKLDRIVHKRASKYLSKKDRSKRSKRLSMVIKQCRSEK